MKIAIQAADLDSSRIDGTRVYILNLLRYFGKLDKTSQFLIYHKDDFNPELIPPNFPNYKTIAKSKKYFWTQTFFAYSIRKENPDVLWMPMHNVPIIRRRGVKTVVTIHDLAFKYFPRMFAKKELWKINLLTKIAVALADKIITISESSKRDILKFYPGAKPENIKVIYHGFDSELYGRERNREKEKEIKGRYSINGPYIIYIGAIQPRKNLEKLVEAFEMLKSKNTEVSENIKNLKLVLAGEKAWLSDGVFEKIGKSPDKDDIICPGKIDFESLGHLLRGADVFVFPSLYEGFGIPILEAFAARVPVICAGNSSLPEVGGEAALYFEGSNANQLADQIEKILNSEELRKDLVAKGLEQIKKFSWEKCAQETLDYLKN